MHLNYIHYNPIKHKYEKKMSKHKYSSFNAYYMVKGKEHLEGMFRAYPVKEYNFE